MTPKDTWLAVILILLISLGLAALWQLLSALFRGEPDRWE